MAVLKTNINTRDARYRENAEAMAALTARLSLSAVGGSGGMPMAVPATGAAAAGGIIGAAMGAKLASWFGLG